MTVRFILVCCLLITFPLFSFAGIVDCKKDKGKEEHCIKAQPGDNYQCTTYVQQQLSWVGRLGVSLQEKKSHKYYKDQNNTQACIGGVAVINTGNYGHVGVVDADLGNMIRIRDRNYCCDGIDRIHEISKAKVAGYICQPHNPQPQPPPQKNSTSYYIRISNIDDEGTCFVNGKKVASVRYYGDTNWVKVDLHQGNNDIEFKVKNKKGGYTYSFEFKEGNDIKWKKQCGEVGRKGCKDNLPKGNVLTKKFTYKL